MPSFAARASWPAWRSRRFGENAGILERQEPHLWEELAKSGGRSMTILLVILILLLIGAFPSWPYSRGWGYYPSGGLGLIVLIVVILLLLHVV
jgi:hypothetical protein